MQEQKIEQDSYEKKYIQMTQSKLSKLIPKMAVPTIIAMLVTSIYNLADTYFVSQIGQAASGAVSIIFSLMTVIQTVGFLLAMGSGLTISRALGAKKNKYAEKVFSTGFFWALYIGIAIMVLGLLFIEPLIYLLGATETIAPLAKQYAIYILLSAPFMTTSFVMNNGLRSQGNAFYSMLGLAAGGILNMIIDPILIFGFNMGITGAGISTAISQLISFMILLYQCNRRSNTMSISFKKFTWKISILKTIVIAGLPNFYRQGLGTVAGILVNIVARPYGDAAIAAIGIVNRITMFITSIILGFGQGFQPVAGFNYGAKKYKRTLQAFWFSAKVSIVTMTIFATIFYIYAGELVEIFRKNDIEVIEIATLMIRFNCITLPLQGFSIMSNMLTQSIGFGLRANLLAISRQGLCFLPLLFVLPRKYNLLGIQIAQPIAELLSFIFSIIIMITVIKDLKNMGKTIESEH